MILEVFHFLFRVWNPKTDWEKKARVNSSVWQSPAYWLMSSSVIPGGEVCVWRPHASEHGADNTVLWGRAQLAERGPTERSRGTLQGGEGPDRSVECLCHHHHISRKTATVGYRPPQGSPNWRLASPCICNKNKSHQSWTVLSYHFYRYNGTPISLCKVN